MTQSGNDSDSQFDLDEFKNRFYEKYPRLTRVLSSFTNNPLSGNTLRVMVRGEEEIDRSNQQVKALQTPKMWRSDASIVVSQYGSYASDALATYWNATLPEIQEQYGDEIRYEHHDVPTPNPSLTAYKLSTVGRTIQHHAGDDAFWKWFNTVMVEGVQSITEAYALVDRLDVAVDQDTVQEAVELDLYENVLWNDIDSLMGKGNGVAIEEIRQQLENSDPVFAVFVNGRQVQPSYDSIVGAIEDVRAAQSQGTLTQQQHLQNSRSEE